MAGWTHGSGSARRSAPYHGRDTLNQSPAIGTDVPEVLVARERGAASKIASGIVRFIKRKPLGAGALFLVLLVAVLSFAAPLVAPYDQFQVDTRHELEGYGSRHWLGTDQLGRDLMSRMFYGARISMAISVGAVALGSTVGFTWGLMSGYFGGKLDLLSQRVIDANQSIPSLILAMALVAGLGPSIVNLIIAISVPFVSGMSRVTRSQVLSLRERPFVDAAKALGATDLRIIIRHVAPNCVAPYLVLVTAELGGAILTESSLSFLGLGTTEPHASLGSMLSGTGQSFFLIAPWMAIWPGIALSILVFGVNLFGDALRDVLDPRLRGSK